MNYSHDQCSSLPTASSLPSISKEINFSVFLAHSSSRETQLSSVEPISPAMVESRLQKLHPQASQPSSKLEKSERTSAEVEDAINSDQRNSFRRRRYRISKSQGQIAGATHFKYPRPPSKSLQENKKIWFMYDWVTLTKSRKREIQRRKATLFASLINSAIAIILIG